MYAAFAARTADQKQRDVLLLLQSEELKHEKLVQMTLEYIDQPATVLETGEFLWYGHDQTP